MPVFDYALTAIAAYLLGSIPTGFLVAKARGVDIRTVGSGNIGATNAMRALGKMAGILVLLADALKGYAACLLGVLICIYLYPVHSGLIDYSEAHSSVISGVPLERFAVIAGIFAVLGHNYTCWLHFKGGKGIATTAGVLIGLAPWALAIILAIWIILFLIARYVSVGSIAAAFALPFATWFTTGHDIGLTIVTGAMGALAIYKHRVNIRRLIEGTENRIEFRKKEAPQ